MPFIHKTSRVKKFRKVYSEENGKISSDFKKDEKTLRKPDEKKRELYYASHLDSLIFSYYAKLLSDKYELKLKSKTLLMAGSSPGDMLKRDIALILLTIPKHLLGNYFRIQKY